MKPLSYWKCTPLFGSWWMFPIMGRVEGPIISDQHDRGNKLNYTYPEEDEGLSAPWRRRYRYFQARRSPKAQGSASTTWCEMRSWWSKFAQLHEYTHAKTSANFKRMRNEMFFSWAFGRKRNRASDFMHLQHSICCD